MRPRRPAPLPQTSPMRAKTPRITHSNRIARAWRRAEAGIGAGRGRRGGATQRAHQDETQLVVCATCKGKSERNGAFDRRPARAGIDGYRRKCATWHPFAWERGRAVGRRFSGARPLVDMFIFFFFVRRCFSEKNAKRRCRTTRKRRRRLRPGVVFKGPAPPGTCISTREMM